MKRETLPRMPSIHDDDPLRFQHLQAGLDLLDQGITVIDGDLKFVAWNKTFLTLLDFPEEMAFVGATFESFIRYNAERGEYGEGDVEEQVRVRVEAAKTFQPHYTERQRPNGRTLAIRGEPIGLNGFVTLYTDITEQRRYEQLIENQNIELEQTVRSRTRELELANHDLRYASRENQRIAAELRRNEERTRTITDNVAALIGYFDANQIYGFANQRHRQWFGRSGEALLGSHVRDILGDALYDEIEPYIQRALGGETVTFEYTGRNEHREEAVSRSTLVPERDPNGTVSGCYVLAVDVTDQKRAEAAVREAQKMEAIGQLAGGLAHDFNNILTVVIGNLSALTEQLAGNAELEEHTRPALRAAQRGVDLVRRLLTIARQQPLAAHAVDVGALIIGLVPLLRGSLPESIAIRTRLGHGSGASAEAFWAHIDPGQLENALINLALNARDAMPQGGTLEIACNRDAVTGEAGPQQATIVISVSDTGHGMDEPTLARAFDPFFTTKPFGRGSGLGLAMVQGFVHQSGGTVTLTSTPGKGTTVRLHLQEVRPESRTLDDNVHSQVGDGEGQLVLLVEDDPDVRSVVRGQLTALGYSVLEADNGLEAADLADNVPDIRFLLSDVVMPGGMDGFQLAARVRETHAEIDIVLMSGYAGDAVRSPVDAGSVPLLAKPFTSAQLHAVLTRSRA